VTIQTQQLTAGAWVQIGSASNSSIEVFNTVSSGSNIHIHIGLTSPSDDKAALTIAPGKSYTKTSNISGFVWANCTSDCLARYIEASSGVGEALPEFTANEATLANGSDVDSDWIDTTGASKIRVFWVASENIDFQI
jgi:hypothetical protein